MKLFVLAAKGVFDMPSRMKMLSYGALGFLIGFPGPVLAWTLLA